MARCLMLLFFRFHAIPGQNLTHKSLSFTIDDTIMFSRPLFWLRNWQTDRRRHDTSGEIHFYVNHSFSEMKMEHEWNTARQETTFDSDFSNFAFSWFSCWFRHSCDSVSILSCCIHSPLPFCQFLRYMGWKRLKIFFNGLRHWLIIKKYW